MAAAIQCKRYANPKSLVFPSVSPWRRHGKRWARVERWRGEVSVSLCDDTATRN